MHRLGYKLSIFVIVVTQIAPFLILNCQRFQPTAAKFAGPS